MQYPFDRLNDSQKFARAVSETFTAMRNSVAQGEPVLGHGSDEDTIIEFAEETVAPEIVKYLQQCNADTFYMFIETIFSLYSSFKLPK